MINDTDNLEPWVQAKITKPKLYWRSYALYDI